jgi:hypothetical protein
MTRVGGGEPPATNQSSSRGHRLGDRGAAVCSGGGRGSDDGVRDGWRWVLHVDILEEVDGGRHRLTPSDAIACSHRPRLGSA